MSPTERHGAGQAPFNKMTEDRIRADGPGGDGLHRSAEDAAERGETPALARQMQTEADRAHAEGRSADQGDGGPGRVDHEADDTRDAEPGKPS